MWDAEEELVIAMRYWRSGFQALSGLMLAVALLAGLTGLAFAQTPTPNQINAIAKDLWCPLCNGVRLDNCELQACIQMKEVIAQKLMASESKEQIRAYFVQQYGDVVLGAPAGGGFNTLVWVLPVLVAVLAIGWLVFALRSWTRKPQPAPAAVSDPASAEASAQAKDGYMKRVDDEMKKYE
jgi:cytochrome c-type biogenesis protein CcmH